MTYSGHGGGCCGISVISGVGGREGIAALQAGLRTHGPTNERLLEVVTTDNQIEANNELVPALAGMGFVPVPSGRFLNSNSGNMCTVWHRLPEGVSYPIDEAPWAAQLAEDWVPPPPPPPPPSRHITRHSLQVGQVFTVNNVRAALHGQTVVCVETRHNGAWVRNVNGEGRNYTYCFDSLELCPIDITRPVEFIDGTPFQDVEDRGRNGKFTGRILAGQPYRGEDRHIVDITRYWYTQFGEFGGAEREGPILRNVLPEPIPAPPPFPRW